GSIIVRDFRNFSTPGIIGGSHNTVVRPVMERFGPRELPAGGNCGNIDSSWTFSKVSSNNIFGRRQHESHLCRVSWEDRVDVSCGFSGRVRQPLVFFTTFTRRTGHSWSFPDIFADTGCRCPRFSRKIWIMARTWKKTWETRRSSSSY